MAQLVKCLPSAWVIDLRVLGSSPISISLCLVGSLLLPSPSLCVLLPSLSQINKYNLKKKKKYLVDPVDLFPHSESHDPVLVRTRQDSLTVMCICPSKGLPMPQLIRILVAPDPGATQ